MHSDGVVYTAASAAITSPLWVDLLDPAYQLILAIIGFAVLVLTLRNKWLDGKIKSATLRALKDDADG
ncbi:MAG: hypothetical protein AAF376_08905 [Pseudomonadota bacterium]